MIENNMLDPSVNILNSVNDISGIEPDISGSNSRAPKKNNWVSFTIGIILAFLIPTFLFFFVQSNMLYKIYKDKGYNEFQDIIKKTFKFFEFEGDKQVGGQQHSVKHTTSKPVHTTSKPVHTTSKPVHTTSKPVHTTSKPVHGTSKPVHGTSKPVHTTSKPSFKSSILKNSMKSHLKHMRDNPQDTRETMELFSSSFDDFKRNYKKYHNNFLNRVINNNFISSFLHQNEQSGFIDSLMYTFGIIILPFLYILLHIQYFYELTTSISFSLISDFIKSINIIDNGILIFIIGTVITLLYFWVGLVFPFPCLAHLFYISIPTIIFFFLFVFMPPVENGELQIKKLITYARKQLNSYSLFLSLQIIIAIMIVSTITLKKDTAYIFNGVGGVFLLFVIGKLIYDLFTDS